MLKQTKQYLSHCQEVQLSKSASPPIFVGLCNHKEKNKQKTHISSLWCPFRGRAGVTQVELALAGPSVCRWVATPWDHWRVFFWKNVVRRMGCQFSPLAHPEKCVAPFWGIRLQTAGLSEKTMFKSRLTPRASECVSMTLTGTKSKAFRKSKDTPASSWSS